MCGGDLVEVEAVVDVGEVLGHGVAYGYSEHRERWRTDIQKVFLASCHRFVVQGGEG